MEGQNKLTFDYVVFDFDGVLVDSTGMKTNVFKQVVQPYSREHLETFIAYHKLHGGVSRWAKFEYFLRNILNITDNKEIEETVRKMADSFSEILQKKLATLKLTNGSNELLEFLKKNNKRCYITSGAAEVEVKQIAALNNIESYFKFILGSPRSKSDNLKILKEKGELQGRGLFIGDSFTDYICAKEFNIDFIYMSNFSEWIDWEKNEHDFFLKVSDLKELVNFLDKEE